MEQPTADSRHDLDVSWDGAQGNVRASRPATGVLLFAFSGRMTPDLVARIRAFVADEIARANKVDVFFDTEAMAGYHPEFRDRMTAWHSEIKPQTRSAHVLVRSKLVAMAIAVANMVTGGLLKSHSERRSFEAALAEARRSAARS